MDDSQHVSMDLSIVISKIDVDEDDLIDDLSHTILQKSLLLYLYRCPYSPA
jgi:hypothetical protein